MQILAASEECGLAPCPVNVVHSIAYLCDALAPVWDVPMLHRHLVKRQARPFFPELQRELDFLVGAGVVQVDWFSHVREGSAGWRIDASYVLDRQAAGPVLSRAESTASRSEWAWFVREVVFGAAGLGPDLVVEMQRLDAAYSEETVHVGNVLDLNAGADRVDRGAEVDQSNSSAEAASRFADIVDPNARLDKGELVHLYMRHLYSRSRVA